MCARGVPQKCAGLAYQRTHNTTYQIVYNHSVYDAFRSYDFNSFTWFRCIFSAARARVHSTTQNATNTGNACIWEWTKIDIDKVEHFHLIIQFQMQWQSGCGVRCLCSIAFDANITLIAGKSFSIIFIDIWSCVALQFRWQIRSVREKREE